MPLDLTALLADLDLDQTPTELPPGRWDWIVVNSSGGKDSQVMLDVVVGLAREAGLLDRVVVVHADLGRVEWPGTRELAERQAAHYGVRFEVVRRRPGAGDLLDHVRRNGWWMKPTTRYCTSDHKRAPIAKLLTSLTREAVVRDGLDVVPRKHRPAVRILQCMGLRAQESTARRKLRPFEQDVRASNTLREVWAWRPIHAWTVDHVWQTIRASGVPYHPAYDLGMPRLSCCFCIYAPRSALLLAGKHNRELLDAYVAVENQIGHRFQERLSLRSIRDALDAGEQPDTTGDAGAWNM